MRFMLIYRPPETKGFTKKFTGTFSATAVKCHRLVLLGGFAALQPEVQLLPRALLRSCSHPQSCCGIDLCPFSSKEDTLCLLLPGQTIHLITTGPQKPLQLDHRNNFSALLVKHMHLFRTLGHPEEQPYSCACSHSSRTAQYINQETDLWSSQHLQASGELGSM